MAKVKQQTYEIAVGLKKGHKVTKNERKKPRPSQQKGVSITDIDVISLTVATIIALSTNLILSFNQ